MFVGFEQQVAIGFVLVPPHPAPQLVKIRQAIPIGIIDENRIGVGNIQSAFDDRRRDQHVEFAGDEVRHDFFEITFVHLAMADAKPRFGHEGFELLSNQVDVVDAIVDKKDLAAAIDFTQDRVANDFVVESQDLGGDGSPILRWRFQVGNIAHADQRHVQRSGNRRCRHGQHVDAAAQ